MTPDPAEPPVFLDDEVPNVARIYDYFLGGAHNFAPDRRVADQMLASWPEASSAARANRNFLQYAVRTALDAGITQFLDLGSGVPTVGNVHAVAQARVPEARVAYVDSEAVAVAHSAEILDGNPGATITRGNLVHADEVLGAPGVAGLLDFDRPIALLAVAALHFVTDDDVLERTVRTYRAALPLGSRCAITHANPQYPEGAARLLRDAGTPFVLRTPERLAGLLEGFPVDPASARDISVWAVDAPGRTLGVSALISDPIGQVPGEL